jgi:hypothetical protein
MALSLGVYPSPALSDAVPVPPQHPPHYRIFSPLTEGLLTLRAKPPSEAEYTDVLQKIKYAFSLLVRTRPPLGLGGLQDSDPDLSTH